MTFEDYLRTQEKPFDRPIDCELRKFYAKPAWDYQQKIIDQKSAEIERMYKDRGLYTAWGNDDGL